ncbi:MAG: esterase-like activity of phytase family protein [Longimicrobiaceae bacterium]
MKSREVPDDRTDPTATIARVAEIRVVELPAAELLLRWQDVEVSGGYGSDLAIDPSDPDSFYLLSDRGPNFDTANADQKGFALPEFTPRIGRFRARGDLLQRVGVIEMRDAAGHPLTGLPHPPGPGSTGETAVTLAGQALPFDPMGIDPEGMAAMPDGSFWIADEYGPQLVHLDPGGRIRERIGPWTVPRALPAVLATRRPNRGLEALALLPDGATLAGITQSSLDNPSADVRGSSAVSRILLFDTRSGSSRQYLYPQEAPGLSNSAICALSEEVLLVIEHDARYPSDTRNPSTIQRVYRVELRDATDVSDPENDSHGQRVEGRTLEQLSNDELIAAGIRTATKELVLDLRALGYPHNKPEGLALIGDRTLVILNDDDFGIESDGRGGIVPKILPATGERDRNTLWFVTLSAPLT